MSTVLAPPPQSAPPTAPLPSPPPAAAPPTVEGFAAPSSLVTFALHRKVSVDEYHSMIAAGILTEDEPVELLEGQMVIKMPRDPSHDGTLDLIEGALGPLLPAGWFLRIQKAITLGESEPEPDIAVVRGDRRAFLQSHPIPRDVGMIVEVANTSLDRDTLDKTRIYARSGIPVYWVVNLPDRRVEVYSQPSGPAVAPSYGRKEEYRPGADVPVVLDGQVVAALPVAGLLP